MISDKYPGSKTLVRINSRTQDSVISEIFFISFSFYIFTAFYAHQWNLHGLINHYDNSVWWMKPQSYWKMKKASVKVSQVLNKGLGLQQQLGPEVSCPQTSCSQPCRQIGMISGAIKKKKLQVLGPCPCLTESPSLMDGAWLSVFFESFQVILTASVENHNISYI